MVDQQTLNKEILDIVIINWESLPQLKKCVQSIASCSQLDKLSIIVVDNSIPPEEVSTISRIANITLLHPGKNLGFGGGCNYGAAQGQADFILFLNPDIIFPTGSIEHIIEWINEDKFPQEAAIIGPRLVDAAGNIQKSIARFPRFGDLFPRMLGLDRLLPAVFKSHYRHDIDYTQNQFVEQVPGAFFLVRRPVFELLEGFDERFFMYYEDVDLAYRTYLAGWKTFYWAELDIQHQGGGTTQTIQARRLAYSMHSRVLYIAKHYGPTQASSVILGITLLEFPARIIRALFRLKFNELINILKSFFIFLSFLIGGAR